MATAFAPVGISSRRALFPTLRAGACKLYVDLTGDLEYKLDVSAAPESLFVTLY
jgi:hypothetical protein